MKRCVIMMLRPYHRKKIKQLREHDQRRRRAFFGAGRGLGSRTGGPFLPFARFIALSTG
jgi:hypothetical protein